MKSKITGGTTTQLFTTNLLGVHNVAYHRCDQTGFIQTDEPFWLDEAYEDVITKLDTGLLARNLEKAELTSRILDKTVPNATELLDYGGGYGIFTRLMRDRGFPFQHNDPHCPCLFAEGFQCDDLADQGHNFQCVTAWEVFEHLPDPMPVFRQIANNSKMLLFSTVLVPNPSPKQVEDWWYFTPETGQHVSFYTHASLKWIADSLGLQLYSDGVANHLFSRDSLDRDPFGRNRLLDAGQTIGTRLLRSLGVKGNSRDQLRQRDYESRLKDLREMQAQQASSPNAENSGAGDHE